MAEKRATKRLRGAVWVLLAVGLPLLAGERAGAKATDAETNKAIAPLQYYGKIPVQFADPPRPETFKSRYGRGRQIRFEPFLAEIRGMYWDCLQRQLRKYPVEFLEKHLDRIYPVRQMYIDGDSIGGFCDALNARNLYVGSPWSVHHEIAEMLFHHAILQRIAVPFPSDEWNEVNARYGADYRNGLRGLKLAGRAGTGEIDAECLRLGFLTEYSSVSMNDDFAVICEHLYTVPEELFAAAGRSPGVYAKMQLAIGFLGRVMGKRLNRAYFRQFDETRRPARR